MRKTFITAALLCLSALCARAQFFTHGSDPSNLRWYSTETPYYKLIYPEGADSLARVYGRLLEQFREPIGHSAGTTPGAILKKMPVVLHTHNPYSNGSVGWAPKRMDMFTVPEPYGADPVPWEVQLTAHEPRHQAQMQYAYDGWFKYGTWLIGDGFSPLVWALYLDWAMGEGDAVVAETGLTTGTRARTADFLNYFRVAYDSGDWRTWNRWRYGSFKYYAPDHYRIGYMTVAGARVDLAQAFPDVLDDLVQARVVHEVADANFEGCLLLRGGQGNHGEYQDQGKYQCHHLFHCLVRPFFHSVYCSQGSPFTAGKEKPQRAGSLRAEAV